MQFATCDDDDDDLDCVVHSLRPACRARKVRIAAAVRRKQVVAALEAIEGGQGPQGKKRRDVSAFSWADHLARLTESEFNTRYDWTMRASTSCWESFDLLWKLKMRQRQSVPSGVRLSCRK